MTEYRLCKEPQCQFFSSIDGYCLKHKCAQQAEEIKRLKSERRRYHLGVCAVVSDLVNGNKKNALLNARITMYGLSVTDTHAEEKLQALKQKKG